MNDPACNGDSPFRNQLQRFGERFAFRFEYARCQCVGRILMGDGNGLLKNHGPVIVLVIDEMDRAPAQFDAVIDRRLVHVMSVVPLSAEGGDQPGMDVDDSILIVVGHDE